MYAPSSKTVVVPPFSEKGFATTRTPESADCEASYPKGYHPTQCDNHIWHIGAEEAVQQIPDRQDPWDVADPQQECDPFTSLETPPQRVGC